MRKPIVLLISWSTVVFLLAFPFGCSSSRTSDSRFPRTSPNPTGESPPALPPSSDHEYRYRATNNDCNCEKYIVSDEKYKIDYLFRATYKMQIGILTNIEIEFTNNSDDTLSFERSAIKVSSRNVKYQYNNKFLPLTWDPILPQSSGSRKLNGKEVTDESNWHKIAGEQLGITIKGILLGSKELKSQTVIFAPENPNLGD